MKVSFSKPRAPKSGALVVFALPGHKLGPVAEALDGTCDGAIRRAIKAATFKGERGDIVELYGVPGAGVNRLVVAGLGRASELDALKVEQIGAALARKLLTSGEKAVTVTVDDGIDGLKLAPEELAAHVAFGFSMRAYRFDRYLTTEPAAKKSSVKTLTVMAPSPGKAEAAYGSLEAVMDGITMARDLMFEPGNVIYPDSYAREVQKLDKLGLKVEVLSEKDMRKLDMNALLGVGQGSANESRLVVMEWRGADDPKAEPVAFVGKGVTFDT
ncbi:MAG: M17 family peptidase N-terminal domain-containing protein, partial [Sphingomonadales bacterium]